MLRCFTLGAGPAGLPGRLQNACVSPRASRYPRLGPRFVGRVGGFSAPAPGAWWPGWGGRKTLCTHFGLTLDFEPMDSPRDTGALSSSVCGWRDVGTPQPVPALRVWSGNDPYGVGSEGLGGCDGEGAEAVRYGGSEDVAVGTWGRTQPNVSPGHLGARLFKLGLLALLRVTQTRHHGQMGTRSERV